MTEYDRWKLEAPEEDDQEKEDEGPPEPDDWDYDTNEP